MLNPREVIGEWNEGYTLDTHTIRSVLVGEDEFGRKIFDSNRSELGELLYQMKYNGHFDNTEKIIELCSAFTDDWISSKYINMIIPVPSSSPTIYALAEGFSNRYDIPFAPDVLKKETKEKAKNMERSDRHIDISMIRAASCKYTILLLDDLFSTGTTANACVRALRIDSNIKNIYFLALTRTRT